jgi:hypothetical protein
VNLAIEQSLADWLRGLPSFDGVAIHTGQSNAEIPGDAPSIIAACESVEAISTTLHKATAALLLSTPSTQDIEQHRALVDAVRSALYAATALAESFAPAATLLGADLQTFTESQTDDRWLCTAQLTLGLAVDLTPAPLA